MGRLVALALLVASCSGDGRAPSPPSSPPRGTFAQARALERGHGVARDYRKAVAIERDLCGGGDADEAPCDAYLWNVMQDRGDRFDVHSDHAIAQRLCARGDAFACSLARDAPDGIADRTRRDCDGGDVRACGEIARHDRADALGNPKDPGQASKALASARRACDLGNLESWGCGAVLAHDGDAAARQRLEAACDDGDADACAQLPGRAIAPADLCAAGNESSCPAGPPFIDFQF